MFLFHCLQKKVFFWSNMCEHWMLTLCFNPAEISITVELMILFLCDGGITFNNSLWLHQVSSLCLRLRKKRMKKKPRVIGTHCEFKWAKEWSYNSSPINRMKRPLTPHKRREIDDPLYLSLYLLQNFSAEIVSSYLLNIHTGNVWHSDRKQVENQF